MNKLIKEALEKIGCYEDVLDCNSMCNNYDYTIGNKYAYSWEVTTNGSYRKINKKKVLITEDFAEELAVILKHNDYFSAIRCMKVTDLIDLYYGYQNN